ncbi:MAG: pentapeptide repeat-containing protein [Acidimicrobiales bacterium]
MTSRPTELRADCEQCVALCCVALPFARSADFPIDKAAAVPCPNLTADPGAGLGCGIHNRLRVEGFAGCTAFDCFGAGQRISQVTFRGVDWRTDRAAAPAMFAAFDVMRQLHEMRWLLAEARAMPAAVTVHAEVDAADADVERAAGGSAGELAAVDTGALRRRVGPLLRRASALTRSGTAMLDRSDADLIGADLRSAALHGADLSGSRLIRADLRGVDLRLADLLGADLRDADVRGADLSSAVYLTQSQVGAARGDASTSIPQALRRPGHWSG